MIFDVSICFKELCRNFIKDHSIFEKEQNKMGLTYLLILNYHFLVGQSSKIAYNHTCHHYELEIENVHVVERV